MFFKIIFFASITILVLGEDPCNSRFDFESDLSQEDCPDDHYYMENKNSVHGCFPSCVKIDYNWNAIECDPKPCPPGYICPDKKPFFCEIDENSCFKYYVNDEKNPWSKAMWKPKCEKDGTWAAKQCKGEAANGRCFCFDEIGNRIFGEQWSNDAGNMTCACSRHRDRLAKEGKRWHVSLHCDRMGNYEPLQCDSGQCWCVYPLNGEISAPAVPEDMMTYLPCYSKSDVGSQYLRQCESQDFAQNNIKNELKIHGTLHANLPRIFCNADGSFGPYKIINSNLYCIWRDGTNIGSWQTSTSELESVNCYCARDTKIYEEAGITQHLQCKINGNYEPLQQANNGLYYCVDRDGFRKSEFFEEESTDCNDYIE